MFTNLYTLYGHIILLTVDWLQVEISYHDKSDFVDNCPLKRWWNKTGNPTSEQQSSLSFERLLHSVTCLISHCHDTQPLLFHLTHFCFIVLFHCGVTQNMEVPFLVCMSSSWFMISIFILCTGAKHLNTCFLFYGYLCHQLEIFPLCSSPSHGIILLNIVAFQPRNSRAFGCEGGSLKFKTLTCIISYFEFVFLCSFKVL